MAGWGRGLLAGPPLRAAMNPSLDRSSIAGALLASHALPAPTCTEPGKTEGSHCSVCNEVLKAQETIPAKGHTPVTDPAEEATCTKAGKTEGSHCSVCNEVLKAQETIDPLGHL